MFENFKMKTKIQENKTETRSSTRLRQKTNLNNINPKSNTTKKLENTAKNRPATRTSNTTVVKTSVLSTKIRQQKSKDTSKTKHDQDSLTGKNNRKSKVLPVQNNEKRIIEEKPKKLTQVLESTTIKKSQGNNITPRKEQLSERLKKLNTKHNVKNTLATPVNKEISSPVKITRVLRKRNNLVPNKYKDISINSPCKKIDKPSTKILDVYEFEVDSSEEKKYNSESSGEEDNSMKVVLKKIRKAHKKAPVKKQKKRIKKSKPVNNDKLDNKNTIIEQKKAVNTKTNKSPQLRELTINIERLDIPSISTNGVEMVTISDNSLPLDNSPIDPSIQARNIVEEVTKSFIEDLSDEEQIVTSPGKINVLSNIVIHNARSDKNKKIFNSTINNLKPPKPWRINVSAIRRKPQYFTYKDKSFTPRYEPELEPITLPKEIQQNENIENNKPTHQTSILDFIKGSKPKIIENNQLFVELPQKNTPRKVLGEINLVQSTPLKTINLNNFNSPNISLISPKKRTDDMFGFSYFSDDENKENIRRSPRKITKSTKEIQEVVKQPESQLNIEKENTEKEPTVDLDDITLPLFQDMDNDFNVSKKSSKKYVRKNPKRKRLPSVDTIPSDDDYEPEVHEKKKQKPGLTKQEELEVDRIASHYNSMFEEIEKYPLVIE